VQTPAEGKGRALLPTLTDFAYKRRIFEVVHDVGLIIAAYYAAFLLRFDGQMVEPFYGQFRMSLPVMIAVQITTFLALGLYRGLWRYTSMSDLYTLLRAAVGAWVVGIIALAMLFRLEGFSRGVLFMDGILLVLGLTGSRVLFRWLRIQLGRLQGTSTSRRVLIYGAGDGGELLVRELLNNYQLGLRPIGFLDDDPHKHGRVIHGLRVFGSLDRLRDVAGNPGVDEIVISTSKIDESRAAALNQVTQGFGIRTRRMRIALE